MGAAPTVREWLRDEPFALAMSSGFFAFFAHTGLVTVLEDEGLLPTRMSGSSAGALVGAAWAVGVDGAALAGELERLRRDDFWDPAPGLGLLRGRRFREKLRALLGPRELHEGRVPVTVSAFEPRTRRTHVLDAGDAAAAIHASCAVPILFHPVRIGSRVFVDGGVADRPGLAGIEPGTRVLFHHIASRSPWRRFDQKGTAIPQRAGLLALVIDGLPRSGPFALDAGRRALSAARKGVKAALDRPAIDGIVRVCV
jgi:NTE family protein